MAPRVMKTRLTASHLSTHSTVDPTLAQQRWVKRGQPRRKPHAPGNWVFGVTCPVQFCIWPTECLNHDATCWHCRKLTHNGLGWERKLWGNMALFFSFFWRTKMVGRGYNIARKSLLGLHSRFLEQFFVVPRNSCARRKACNTCTCSKFDMDTGYYRIPQIGIQRSYISNHHLILCQWESIVKHVYTLPKTNITPWN